MKQKLLPAHVPILLFGCFNKDCFTSRKSAFLRLGFIRTLVLLLILFNYLDASAQLKYDPEKARQELEYLANQKKLESQNTVQSQEQNPGYSIEQREDLIVITFNKNNTKVTAKNFFQEFKDILSLKTDDHFVFINSKNDNLGFTHYRYDQFYKGVPVMGGQFLIHEKDGKLDFVNGKFYQGLNIDVRPAMTKEKAISASKTFIGAKKYLWENESAQNALRNESRNLKATYYPKPELVIVPKNGEYKKENFRLSYKVDIASEIPYNKVDVYIDAHSGEVVNNISKIAYADVPGTKANTLYNNVQDFTTDNYKGTYRLKETSVRSIQTLNMLNGVFFLDAIDFISKNNSWKNSSSIITNITILNVNSTFKDREDTKPNDADIYIEIRDANNNLVFENKVGAIFTYTRTPFNINIDNIPLLEGNYTLKIFDYDFFTNDDLLGSFIIDDLFTANNGITKTIKLINNGTECNITGKKSQSGALDVHWGMEKVYDYYYDKHAKRRSYDGENSPIISYLHPHTSIMPGRNINNAYWDGDRKIMVFGDGDGTTWSSPTALDICGHEMTHGFIQFNSNGGIITNQGESGALNESFADILGTAVEFYTLKGKGNWTMGEQFIKGGYARSLEKPKSKNHPNTYEGQHWSTNGVHGRAGVQNFWFYLLTNGGNGNIDNKYDSYNVQSGIGIDKAATIAYTNMMQYLQPNARYLDAYLMSLKAALSNKHSEVSNEYKSVREAWYAVGVAKKPEITAFAPMKGNVGTKVTLTGKNFDGISQIGFNGTLVDAPNFTVNKTGTEIIVNVPTGATTGKISIVAGYQTVKSTADFTIECTTPLTVTVSSTDASSFTVSVSGGAAPYSYSLDNSNFQNSNEFKNLATGKTYTVYVKDAGGCTGQSTFFLSDPIKCNIQSGSGGQGTTFITQILGTSAGSVSVSYEMYNIPDQMDVYYNNALVASTKSLVSGNGKLTFNYKPLAGGPYYCIIRIYAPNNGTVWDFIAACPVSSSAFAKNSQVGASKETESVATQFQAVLSPNPSSEVANLQISGSTGEISVLLTDITGKEVWQTRGLNKGNIPIPVKDLRAGTYIVIVSTNYGQRKTLKLVKIE
ncbi:M4 family metallopeptidase [Adhaeribacter pallidiroseus]|uniref:Thermolysin n=1 Tax=Adhaeribacter pallidiroseus TaxID=2072847 RepID=A0A369QNY7_9BACT|nr:M4 family metallopeptidase [Adhaeribacter pallidiroseus]RDC66444.1 Thermolysin [Adhaeribacter pallidiroseus]